MAKPNPPQRDARITAFENNLVSEYREQARHEHHQHPHITDRGQHRRGKCFSLSRAASLSLSRMSDADAQWVKDNIHRAERFTNIALDALLTGFDHRT